MERTCPLQTLATPIHSTLSCVSWWRERWDHLNSNRPPMLGGDLIVKKSRRKHHGRLRWKAKAEIVLWLSVHEQVVKWMFKALSAEEQDEWAEMAKQEHKEDMEKWMKVTSGDVSANPADWQRYSNYLICNVLLHLVMVPSNHTHEILPRHVQTSCSPLIRFITASHYVIVSTVPIVIDMTHYVIVTTVFPPDTLFHTIAL